MVNGPSTKYKEAKMKKLSLRIVSAFLAVMTLMSVLSCMSVFATETTEETVQYATGDLSLEYPELEEDLEVIESVSEYNEIVNGEDTASTYSLRASSYPSSVDNSTSIYFPAIGSQGRVGSCTAWATCYYQFTYEMNRSIGRTTTPENTFSPKWVYNKINRGIDTGSTYVHAYNLMKSQGCVQISDVPYDEDFRTWSPSDEYWTDSLNYRLNTSQLLYTGSGNTPITSPDDSDLNTVKAALANGEVLTFSTYFDHWAYSTIESNTNAPENSNYIGESIATAMNSYEGGHRMTLVGYNDDIWVDINGNGTVETAEKGAFKVANSWGTDYGNDGFIWVAYDALNTVSALSIIVPDTNRGPIFNSITRITVRDYDSDADINLVYTLNSARRNQTSLTVTAVSSNGTKYSGTVSPYRDSNYSINENNNYSYDGKTSSNDGTMVFALDNIVSSLTSDTFDDYTWTVTVADTSSDSYSLTVKDLKIVDNNTGKTINSSVSMPVTLNGASKTIGFGDEVTANEVTIYYRGYSNPNIHYQVGTGSWTSVPGVAMTASSEVDGYTHTYTIDLGDSTYANVCFNDGNGNWDSRNGANYKFEAGTYTYSNGTITAIEVDKSMKIKSFDITPSSGKIAPGESVKMDVTLSNAPSTACIKYSYIDPNGNECVIYDYTSACSASKQFTVEGTYTLIVRAKESYASIEYVEARKTITVAEKASNTCTIYYKGYSTPYIHYQVGTGSWTSVPGYAMTATSEVSGYTHKYTIDLGESTYANVCFNNGNNTWDSKNGANYKFYAGTYTYSNGTITEYKPAELEATLTSSKVQNIGRYEYLTFTAKATGGTAPYKYKFTYTRYGQTYTLRDYSTSNVCNLQTTEIGPYTVNVTVMDANSNTVYASCSVTCNQTYIMEFNADKETGYVGESVKFSAETLNEANVITSSNYVYTVTKDGVTTTLNTASDKTATWTPTEAGTYQVKLSIVYDGNTIVYRTMDFVVEKVELTATLTSSKTQNIGCYEYLTFTAKASGGTAPYKYKFTYTRYGQTYTLRDYSTTSVCGLRTTAVGPYAVNVTVMDANGDTVSTTCSVTCNQTYIMKFNADKETVTVGESVKFSAETLNEADAITSTNYIYTVTKDNVTTTLNTASDKTATWTPSAAGTYQVKLSIVYDGNTIVYRTMDYVVEEAVVDEVTIYYKGYSNPNIHYQVGTGSWTSVPGKAMTATSEVDGYTHKYTIDLGDSTYANVCFNDGNGNWDSRNGANYKFYAGTYTFSNGTITEYEFDDSMRIKSFDITPSDGKIAPGDSVKMTVTLANAPTNACIQYLYADANGNEFVIYDYATAYSALKQFTVEGTYTLIVRAKESFVSTDYIEARKTVTVKEESSNTLTIYYKGYSTPYIHYQVGSGSWTAVPGIAMTATSEKSGYTHKYTIDLGTSTYANVCFNDGNGNWDSKNGANYKFYSGTYTYSNGTMTKIS